MRRRARHAKARRRCSRSPESTCCRPGRSSSSFVAAGLALNIVPGADMTFIIASAARGGRRDGVDRRARRRRRRPRPYPGGGARPVGDPRLVAGGVRRDQMDAGAAYLLWLAVSLLRAREAPARGRARPPASGWRLFRAAMLVNILNPKVALFFLAFLPQFVDPAAAIPALQILCLGLWFDFAGTLVNIAVALAAAGAAARLRHVDWLGGPRAGSRRRRWARSRCSSRSARAVRHKRRGRPSSAPPHKPGGRGCARASRSDWDDSASRPARCAGGLEREAHHDVGGGELVAGEPGAGAELGLEPVEMLARTCASNGLRAGLPSRPSRSTTSRAEQGRHHRAFGIMEEMAVAQHDVAIGRRAEPPVGLLDQIFDDRAGLGDRARPWSSITGDLPSGWTCA